MDQVKTDFVVCTHNGVTAVMTWDDYQASRHRFAMSGRTVIGVTQPGARIRIAVFSNKRHLACWMNGDLDSLARLIAGTGRSMQLGSQIQIYVPFSNGREDYDNPDSREFERRFRLTGEEFADMFGFQLPNRGKVDLSLEARLARGEFAQGIGDVDVAVKPSDVIVPGDDWTTVYGDISIRRAPSAWDNAPHGNPGRPETMR